MNPYDLLHRAQQTPGLTQTQKGVLIALLTFADANGWAWPSIDTIAEYASLKERSVQNAIAQLVACGIVDRHDRAGATCRYQVRFDRLAERREGCTKSTPARRAPPHEKHPRMKDTPARRAPLLPKNEAGGVHDERGGVHLVHRGGAFGAPEVAIEDTNEDTITPPTPSFDSTVDVPAVNEEEEDNSQQNPEDSCTQQPKSMIEPEQTMDPNDYDHDKEVNNNVSAAVEELKIRKLSMTGIAGVDPKDIPVGYFAHHIENPDINPSLWKELADRRPKEKVRDIVPFEEIPPDPEMDAILAEHWKSPVTIGIPCLLNGKQTDTPPDDEPPKTFLRRSTVAPVASNAVKKPVPVPLPPPPRISATGEVQTGDLFGRRSEGAPVAPVAIVEEAIPTTMLPPEVTDFVVLLANRPDGTQSQPVAIVQRWIRALVNAGITTPQQLEETTFNSLKFTGGIGENNANIIAKAMVAWGSSLAPEPRIRMFELRTLAARHSTMPPEVTSRDRRWLKAANIHWNDIRKMTDFNLNDFAKRIESARSAA